MKKFSSQLSLLGAALVSSYVAGCSFHARGPDDYRKDARAVLEERGPKIQECYEAVLKEDKNAKGDVTLSFVIQKDTGEFTEIKVTGDASDELKACVEKSVQGLKLIPVDARDGHGEFTYTFEKS